MCINGLSLAVALALKSVRLRCLGLICLPAITTNHPSRAGGKTFALCAEAAGIRCGMRWFAAANTMGSAQKGGTSAR